MKKSILIERYSFEDKQTLGKLYVLEEGYRVIFNCDTLELPWKDNKKNVSHIKAGKYKGRKRRSNAHKEHIHILGTENRSFILIHSGNYYNQIEGCILVGDDLADLNKDGILDVTNSRSTLDKILEYFSETEEIEIEIIERK